MATKWRWKRRRNKAKQKEKRYSRTTWESLSALSIHSSAECSEPFISVTLCQQANQRQWKRRCLSSRQSHAARSEDAELHCSYDGRVKGGVGVRDLCAASRCWGIDRAQWWTGGVSPAANQKLIVCPSEEGKWRHPPTDTHTHTPHSTLTSLPRYSHPECTSPAPNSNSNATAFDFCLRAFRTPVFGANTLLTLCQF